MPGFVCPHCGKTHEGLPMDIEYTHPADYFRIRAKERSKRVFFNEDLCIIDNKEFIIRGVLVLPIRDSDTRFAWGIWALVSEKDFERYIELWRTGEEGGAAPFPAKLSGGIGYYKDSDLLDVTVHLRPAGKRPLFEVVSDRHPLGIDQRQGITLDKVHDFIEKSLPGFFNSH